MSKLEFQNIFIKYSIKNNKNITIGKIGANELNSIFYLKLNSRFLYYNCGIFPNTPEFQNIYIKMLKSAIKSLDIIAIWGNNRCNQRLLSHQNSIKVELRAFEPYYHIQHWSKILKNKNVLVISPFTDSISKQYKKRNLIWEKEILPEFNLITLKFPLSHALKNTKYNNFIELFDSYKETIKNINFDIALIGCGGYSLLLCEYIKQQNKSSFHLGGALQILLGIKGNRWDNHDIISRFYNSHWIRPSSNEVPNNTKIIENSAYW